ncbi:cilia- and flagella-associated protein 221 [Clupea harengus]|uniref:Cilia- and flagella-associated protein 221 n=1 Tax=Clupea harengus TaxID=7950 RepID=A0A6P8EE23_CLUHA|nr:cilia- and flagella-associated protein 221 [Clupea harengus]
MDVVQSAPESFTSTFGKKTPLPLLQLVEEVRRDTDVPHHLLETKIFAKLQNNSLIQAEPSEVHFRGFELGKDYKQLLKLTNISSDVIDIHIIPTQTKYFQTAYTKKHRLVPGLSYTVKLNFFPDEWRYFYDCIRIHCKNEENILVPVHAYPVIDDLDIPSHISLPAVALGQSLDHVIPLSCSCPVDFEFQVYCLQPSEAFSIQPFSGVIPARGVAEVTVTFTPFQYGTAQVTIQLVISQFNSRPYVCTLSGRCPNLALSKQIHDEKQPKGQKGPTSLSKATKPKLRATRPQVKIKEQKKPQAPCQKTPIDVRTPAGVAKLLMKPLDKLSAKELRDAMSYTRMEHKSRQVREAIFENQVRQDVQEERANRLRWQVHLGKDPLSVEARVKILEERKFADNVYKIKRGELEDPEDFSRAQTNVSTRRAVRCSGQLPDCVPKFHTFFGSPLEIRQRALRTFQQAARKVVLRCRMDRRLSSIRQPTENVENPSKVSLNLNEMDDESNPVITADTDRPASAPGDQQTTDEVDAGSQGPLPVKPSEVITVEPKEELQPPAPKRPSSCPEPHAEEELEKERKRQEEEKRRRREERKRRQKRRERKREEEKREKRNEEGMSEAMAKIIHLSFSAPGALMEPPPAHPLRIFNPCPGLNAYRPSLSYLECDLEFHLCPLPRYTISKGNHMMNSGKSVGNQKKFLDRTDVICGVMTWKKFTGTAVSILSSTSTLTSNWAPQMSDPLNAALLSPQAPSPLSNLPEEIREEVQDGQADGEEVTLTPEMVQAQFPFPGSHDTAEKAAKADSCQSQYRSPHTMPSHSSTGSISREMREQLLCWSARGQSHRLGLKVWSRLSHLQAKNTSTASDD